jgi:acid phosphatase class B
MSLEPAGHHLLEYLFTFPLNLRASVHLIFVNSIHNSLKGTHCMTNKNEGDDEHLQLGQLHL